MPVYNYMNRVPEGKVIRFNGEVVARGGEDSEEPKIGLLIESVDTENGSITFAVTVNGQIFTEERGIEVYTYDEKGGPSEKELYVVQLDSLTRVTINGLVECLNEEQFRPIINNMLPRGKGRKIPIDGELK